MISITVNDRNTKHGLLIFGNNLFTHFLLYLFFIIAVLHT